MSESIYLADGRSVPTAAVTALDELERIWPGATLPQARPAIAAAVIAGKHVADVKVTKTRDGEGWRRVRCGKGALQVSLILDDRAGHVGLLDSRVSVEKIPNLIAALEAARDAISNNMTEGKK